MGNLESYSTAMADVDAARQQIDQMLTLIKKLGEVATRWRYVDFEGIESDPDYAPGLAKKFVRKSTWPSFEEFTEAVSAYRLALKVAMVAYQEIPEDVRGRVQRPS